MSGATPEHRYQAALQRALGSIQLARMWASRADGSTDYRKFHDELSKLALNDPPDDDAEQPP